MIDLVVYQFEFRIKFTHSDGVIGIFNNSYLNVGFHKQLSKELSQIYKLISRKNAEGQRVTSSLKTRGGSRFLIGGGGGGRKRLCKFLTAGSSRDAN